MRPRRSRRRRPDRTGADRRRSLGYRRLGVLRLRQLRLRRFGLYAPGGRPAPIYVVNQGPEYTGPGNYDPLQHLFAASGFGCSLHHPYISGPGYGYGYGHRYGYRHRYGYGHGYGYGYRHGYAHPDYRGPRRASPMASAAMLTVLLRPEGAWRSLRVSASPGRHAELLTQTISQAAKARPGAGLRLFWSPDLRDGAARDIKRQRRGVRDVETFDRAGKIEPRQPITLSARPLPQALALGAEHQRQR